MPRDVEEEVHGLEHVYLYRLADLEAIAAENLKSRAAEVERARALARAKALELEAWLESLKEGQEISLKHSDAERR
jgi:glutamyl-tRNA reductase